MLIIVFSVFALCWLPGQVFQLYLAVTEGSKDLPVVQVACYWFGYNNSAINPWLYICMNSKIHSAFSSMFGRKFRLEKRNSKFENNEMMPQRWTEHKIHTLANQSLYPSPKDKREGDNAYGF